MAYTEKNPNGQATMANSAPVVVASNQSAVPVTVATVPLPTGAATEAKQDTQITAEQAIQATAGAVADAVVAAGATGSISAKLRRATQGLEDLKTLIVLAAGTNAIGKLLPPDVDVTTHANYIRKYFTNAGAVTDGIIWSPAAGKRWHVVTMYIQTSVDATITLEDDKAGGDDAIWKGEVAAKSGVVLTFPEKYPMASAEDAADLMITTSTGNVYVTVVGYEI